MCSETPELLLNQLYEDWIRFSVNGHLRSCSNVLRERWTETGLLGTARQSSEFFKLSADDSETFFSAWVSAVKGAASSMSLQLRGFDLAERSVVFMPELAEGGTVLSVVVGVLGVCENGTEASSGTENAVEKLAEVREMFQDVAQSKRELEKALQFARSEIECGKAESQAKTNFLANMSHEIRTPMNAVIGFCDLLSNSSLTKEQSEYVDAINHSGRLLIDLVGQVLDYSKIDSGHLDLDCSPLNLESIITEVRAIVGPNVQGKPIELAVDCRQVSSEALLGDATRVKQILVNLLSNAYRFTREGQISLVATTTTSEYRGHLCLRVRIEDTGVGISSERIRTLFSPFAQAHNEHADEFGGTGLGLAICKRLCQAMRGDVWVEESEIDKGTVFIMEIHLPRQNEGDRSLNTASAGLKKKTMESSENKTVEEKKEPAPLRLLVVDDNPNNLLITSKLSQHLGYKAETVSNGVEALQKMKDGDFHIVLMDVRMAPLNGMETTRMIREGEAGEDCSGAYIIAVTAHALQGDKERCIQSGMNDYLAKPLTLERLQESLNRARSELSLD